MDVLLILLAARLGGRPADTFVDVSLSVTALTLMDFGTVNGLPPTGGKSDHLREGRISSREWSR
jgi:hypothetical protein